MSPLLISFAVFIAVAALIAAVSTLFRGESENKLEDRLTTLTTRGLNPGAKVKETSLLDTFKEVPGIVEWLINKSGTSFDLRLYCEQADVSLSANHMLAISGGCFLGGTAIGFLAQLNPMLCPLVGLGLSTLPFVWLMLKRSRRLKKFAGQLPDALDLMGRALRSGQSLGAAFDLVSQQMKDPVASEFGRVFETQNFGVPLEEALQDMTYRVPNLDLKFFATAVTLQRQTGGDLAEILDKIGHLIRERFKIWGQIQALTGEGRISGIVLLGLPPVLFLAVYKLNPDYVMVLFTDPMGKQLLGAGIVTQIIGALVIRKIINIKV